MTTALDGVRGQRHIPTALYPGKDPVPIVQEAGWAPGPVWTGAENLAATEIRSPDRPAGSEYRKLFKEELLATYFPDDQTKKDAIAGACNQHMEDEKCL